MDLDQVLLDRALGRIHILIVSLSIGGLAAAATYGGWKWACGFLLGSGASWLNFRWLKKLVDALGQQPQGKRLKNRTAVLLGLRYLILAAAGYGILNFSEISLTAALVGLFVSAAAVILEILFQLFAYGST